MGIRSPKVIAKAFSAGFRRMVHRAWPRPVGCRDLVTTLPVVTSFQFRNTGRTPLVAVWVTMPPRPGDGEAVAVPEPRPPSLKGDEAPD